MDIGDSVGALYKRSIDGSLRWALIEDKINKITITKNCGRRYFTQKQFNPLEADDVDSNTKIMEEAIGKGYIITGEVFGLNDKTRPFAERWVKWANKNPDKAVDLAELNRLTE